MKKLPVLKTAMTPFPCSVARDHKVVGVITDRDMTSARHVHAQSNDRGRLSVSDLYMVDPCIVSLDEPLENILLTMAERHIGSAIVARAGKLVGVFTSMDACRIFGKYLHEHASQPGDDTVA